MKNILLINERGPDFWNNTTPAETTSHAWLSSEGETPINHEEYKKILGSLEGKKVLVLIHGLKNFREDVLHSYTQAHKEASQLLKQAEDSFLQKVQNFIYSYTGFWQPTLTPAYDAVIGISWPSYSHELYYYHAKENAQTLAPKVAKHLSQIAQVASNVDVLAHSLGNYMLFEALKSDSSGALKLHHIYALAAAVPRDTLNKGKLYEQIAQKCQHLFVLFSKHDEALQWPFYLAEGGKEALGLSGANHQAALPENITSVDCSQIAAHHSAYLQEPLFYQFIESSHNASLPYFDEASQVQIAENGNILARN